MASVTRQRKPYTYEDFCTIVPDGQKADLIDGAIYVASPDNTDANDIFMRLGGLMYDFAEYRDLGTVFGSRVACKLDEYNAPEPDILFVAKGRKDRILRGRIDGPADLAVEIVSPDSQARDYEKKRELYQRFGVPEYWIVDETKKSATFLRLGVDGKYAEVKPRGGIVRSKAFKGFWIRLEWLWPDTRPRKADALRELLKRKP